MERVQYIILGAQILRSPVRRTEWRLCRGVRHQSHIDRGSHELLP